MRVLLLAVLAFALAGCTGLTQNPSYFPFYLPTGDVVPTHAKPPGLGYFHNFDRKAARLEVTPTSRTAPTRTQQVLIATVYDADGDARRARRVEWMLEGPGNIIEVDESGYFNGRGYKVDNRYAVSYTDYFEHTITRGTKDERDDFTIKPGQSWCVVSSAIEGQTVVTVYAPEVFDWDKGRCFVKLTWGDAEFSFPPPATARKGGDADLVTTIQKDSAAGYKVRYRILGGAPASLVSQPGSSGTYNATSQEAEALADARGAAGIRVTQATPTAGSTRVAVEIVKPDANGTGPGIVVGRSETRVEWGAAQLGLDVQLPAAVGLNAESTARLTVSNNGKAESSAVGVRATLPDGVAYVRSEPPGTLRGREVVWEVPGIPGTQKRELALTLRPLERGQIALAASAQTLDGLKADARAMANVDAAGLKLSADATGTTVRVSVANTGAVAVTNAVAWLNADGLRHASGANPVEVPIGTVEPGRTKSVEVPFDAERAGRFPVKVNVTADGNLADRAETVVVGASRASISARIVGPEELHVGQEGIYEVFVTNTGEGAVAEVRVRPEFPRGLTLKENADARSLNGIPAGETRSVRFVVTAARLFERDTIRATATAEVPNAKGVEATATQAVSVGGTPALVLTLAEPAGPLTVGGRAVYRVTVANRGTGPAKKVDVGVELSREFKPVRAVGPGQKDATMDGGRVRFAVVEELPAGSSAVFLVDADAVAPGDGRAAAEVRAAGLSRPLREEQPARVGGR